MHPSLVNVQKHTSPHHYKFSRQDGKVIVSYKSQQHLPWEPLQTLFKWKPKRKPPVLKPSYDSIDFESLDKQVKKMKYLFTDEQKTLGWWEKFITSHQKNNKRQCSVKFLRHPTQAT